jgi:hypothetical protein
MSASRDVTAETIARLDFLPWLDSMLRRGHTDRVEKAIVLARQFGIEFWQGLEWPALLLQGFKEWLPSRRGMLKNTPAFVSEFEQAWKDAVNTAIAEEDWQRTLVLATGACLRFSSGGEFKIARVVACHYLFDSDPTSE